ncbi:MAG TPA: DUF6807 family protein [Gemmataceae bacterium]|jgi:hypothetical protein
MTREQRLVLLLPVMVLLAALPAQAQGLTEPLFPADVDLWVNRANIEFRVYKNTAAIYEFGTNLTKPYFWPLQAPNHKQVTRSWPMLTTRPSGSTDSPHHKSAWFGFGDVIPEGVRLSRKVKGVEGVDFWSEKPDSGRIICVSARDGFTVRKLSASSLHPAGNCFVRRHVRGRFQHRWAKPAGTPMTPISCGRWSANSNGGSRR